MQFLLDLFAQLPEQGNPLQVTALLIVNGGWVFLVLAFLWGGAELWLRWRQNLYLAKQRFVLLAIDVPKDNEQTPKAVEHLFAHIHGIHKNPNVFEKWIEGYVQPSMSLELVSIDGYIQFLIRTPVKFRDLVEAAIYAQYPNAEISDVEDYATNFPAQFPNDRFDIWGSEIVLVSNEVLPIRTYPAFEHPLTQTFLDPMASTLELLGRMHQGEQIWLQLIINPPKDDSWRDRGIRLIKKMIGAKARASASRLDAIGWLPGQVIQGLTESFTAGLGTLPFGEEGSTRRENGLPSLMQHLAPYEKNVVESIGFKISKLGFQTKFRFIYLAEKQLYDKSRVNGIFGALKQLAALDLNGLKPDKKTKTQVDPFFEQRRLNARKRRLLLGYQYRSNWRGRNRFILNTEELATLWHFPVITVKAPLVQKAAAKRGEPPIQLPVDANPQPVPTPGPRTPRAVEPVGLPTVDTPASNRPLSTPGSAPGNLPVP